MDPSANSDNPGEPTISSQRIYDGRVVKLRVDTVQLPGGRTARREIVEHPGAVALVALDPDGKVLLVRQYRKPVERALLEIPAGTLNPGEDPAACAARELAEETGYRPGKLVPLVGFYSAPGFCEEYLHVYLATDLSPAVAEADADESIELVRLPLAECLRLARAGEIRDAKSLIGLLAAQAGWGEAPRGGAWQG